MEIQITDQPLSVDMAYQAVLQDNCGAVCLFTGNVRDHNDGKTVTKMKYTAFAEMAQKELRKIADEAVAKWEVEKIYLAHRTGALIIGDISVIVAVSAPHRGAAFEAGRFMIDTLKKTTPIWKEEFYEEGKSWVT